MTRRAESVAPKRASTVVLTPGTCRICGCTSTTPCALQTDNGEVIPCWWIDPGKTLCSGPQCIAQVPLDELVYLGLEERMVAR